MRHTNAQLAKLEERLLALPAENDGMLVSELDGFVAGLIIGPEIIMPGEWLPEVWGDDQTPNFANLEDASATLDAVMAHYNRVALGLAKAVPAYEALFDRDPINGELMWELWITGFQRAMQLRSDLWRDLIECDDKEVVASMRLIAGLCDVGTGQSKLAAATIAQLQDIALQTIPDVVLTFNAHTKRRVAPANRSAVPSGAGKVGRNAPCPCQSGRKYKKCCGAGASR